MGNRRRLKTAANSAPRKSGGFGRRVFRWLGLLLLAWVLLTALPVLALRWVAPFSSAFMLHARVEAMSVGNLDFRNRYDWVNFEKIAPHAALAVIAAEDQQFADHFGFDLRSIREAAKHNQRSK